MVELPDPSHYVVGGDVGPRLVIPVVLEDSRNPLGNRSTTIGGLLPEVRTRFGFVPWAEVVVIIPAVRLNLIGFGVLYVRKSPGLIVVEAVPCGFVRVPDTQLGHSRLPSRVKGRGDCRDCMMSMLIVQGASRLSRPALSLSAPTEIRHYPDAWTKGGWS